MGMTQKCLVCESERTSEVCETCGFRHKDPYVESSPYAAEYMEEIRAAQARWKVHEEAKQRITELEAKLAALELRMTQPTASLSLEPLGWNLMELDCGRGVKIRLKKIEAGSFMMGGMASSDEQPVHRVTFDKPFYMGIFPVSQSQFGSVMEKNPSWYNKEHDAPSRPVEQVNWLDAKSFCRKLSKMTGQKVQLPTEAQWEYCCRAGSETEFCFGNEVDQLALYANYSETPVYGSKSTSPVGGYRPNAWGLYDMHGNVWEWCEDRWHRNYHGAPEDGSAWLTGDDPNRVRRGGCWYYDAGSCRSANRLPSMPSSTNYLQGFRVCVVPKTGENAIESDMQEP